MRHITGPRRGFVAALAALVLIVLTVAVQPVAASRSEAAAPGRRSTGDLPGNRPGQGLVFNDLEVAASDRCAGMYEMEGSDRCSHGPDSPPPGYTMAADVVPLAPEGAGDTTALAAVCSGDGTSGNRVQALYVHAPGNDRFEQYRSSLVQWVAGIDTIYDESARETGGSRHVRFVHDASCAPVVENVEISSTALSSFGRMVSALEEQGYNRRDRKYVIFGDARVYCGIGEFAGDTRKTEANRSNSGPSYARVDASCWNSSTAAHELGHTIGAVNNNAPNSSGGGHCTDEWDVMCYSDSPNYPQMRTVCADRAHDARLDCGHDDYYHTDPDPSSYLGRNWNVADSLFLFQGEEPPPTTAPTTTTSTTVPPTTTTAPTTTTTQPTTTTTSTTVSPTTVPPTTTTASTTTTTASTTTSTLPPTVPPTEPPTTVAPTTTTTVPPTPTPCEGYARLVTGTLAEGASQVQPGGWYYFARSGFHAACLDAPDGVNFDVTLQRFAGMRWVDVASATGSGGDETVTFNGRYGIYRYLVTAVSGSGAYTLGFKRP